MRKTTARGFTLIELLIVIAIIAVLAAVVLLIVNPIELTKRSRDAARLTDLSNLQQAISIAVQEGTPGSQTQPACNSNAAGAPTACGGRSDTGARNTNGSGWVVVNFSGQSNVTVPTLPVDPTNNANLHYTYCGLGTNWKIKTVLESQQQSPKMSVDGDNDNATYSVGSDMSMTCAYPG